MVEQKNLLGKSDCGWVINLFLADLIWTSGNTGHSTWVLCVCGYTLPVHSTDSGKQGSWPDFNGNRTGLHSSFFFISHEYNGDVITAWSIVRDFVYGTVLKNIDHKWDCKLTIDQPLWNFTSTSALVDVKSKCLMSGSKCLMLGLFYIMSNIDWIQ